jgi:hypothetical protein
MFRKTKELQSLVNASRSALKEAEKKIKRLEASQKDLKSEIEDEHLENYKQHRKLLEIEKLLQEQDYNSIENLKNKIRTILNKKELVDLLKSN